MDSQALIMGLVCAALTMWCFRSHMYCKWLNKQIDDLKMVVTVLSVKHEALATKTSLPEAAIAMGLDGIKFKDKEPYCDIETVNINLDEEDDVEAAIERAKQQLEESIKRRINSD